MLRLKGEPLGGGRVRGYISIAGAENIPLVAGADGMMRPAAGGDHLAGSVFVFAGSPSPESLLTLPGSSSGLADCAAIVEHCSLPMARRIAELGMSAVSGIARDYFRPGDTVVVSGSEGSVEMNNVCAREVVSCLVQSGGKTLILKRSEAVGSWQGKWAAVSGYIEEGETPAETAFKEIREELSVENATMLRKGQPIVTRKEGIVWISHPFLFELKRNSSDIRIDWEHTDFRWITLSELPSFDTVPGLERMLTALGLC